MFVYSITHGALSNATLLVQYRFCLPDNVEPDGSSNNVDDFVVACRTGGVTTAVNLPLRTGPQILHVLVVHSRTRVFLQQE